MANGLFFYLNLLTKNKENQDQHQDGNIAPYVHTLLKFNI